MRRRVIARPVGSSVRLKCVASGHPRPDIMWMKDDQALTGLEAGEHRKKKWTLSLKNLRPEDSGKYTCRVSNRAGAINATYKVDVIRECQGCGAAGGWRRPGVALTSVSPCRADTFQARPHGHAPREHDRGLWGHHVLPVQSAQ